MSIPGLCRAASAAAFAAALSTFAGCTVAPAPPPASTAATTPIPPGYARLWLYRDYQPSVGFNMANIDIDGARVASVPAFGPGIYHDVPAGTYHVSAEGLTAYDHQSADIAVAPGQELFLQVEDSPLVLGGDRTVYQRDVFYVRPVPAELARAQIAASPR